MATHRGSWGGGAHRAPPGGRVASQEASGHPLPRGVAAAGREAKKCTFRWVFNNSPSRDKIRHFFAIFWPFLDLQNHIFFSLKPKKWPKIAKIGVPENARNLQKLHDFPGVPKSAKNGHFSGFLATPRKTPIFGPFWGCPGGGIEGAIQGVSREVTQGLTHLGVFIRYALHHDTTSLMT